MTARCAFPSNIIAFRYELWCTTGARLAQTGGNRPPSWFTGRCHCSHIFRSIQIDHRYSRSAETLLPVDKSGLLGRGRNKGRIFSFWWPCGWGFQNFPVSHRFLGGPVPAVPGVGFPPCVCRRRRRRAGHGDHRQAARRSAAANAAQQSQPSQSRLRRHHRSPMVDRRPSGPTVEGRAGQYRSAIGGSTNAVIEVRAGGSTASASRIPDLDCNTLSIIALLRHPAALGRTRRPVAGSGRRGRTAAGRLAPWRG